MPSDFVTPDTTAYMWLGLAATFGTLALLAGSVWLRFRGAAKDIELIEQLENDDA